MIKLKLPGKPIYEDVKLLPGLHGLKLDDDYGLVLIDPKHELYVVRCLSNIHYIEDRKEQSPEILEIYPDIKIEPIYKQKLQEVHRNGVRESTLNLARSYGVKITGMTQEEADLYLGKVAEERRIKLTKGWDVQKREREKQEKEQNENTE